MERIPVSRPVHRIRYIAEACRNRVVLDLGAMDETAYEKNRGQGAWLHEEIAKVEERVVGLDSSELIVEEGTSIVENAVIKNGDIFDLELFFSRTDISPDVVGAGELIDHLESPISFLRSVHNSGRLMEYLLEIKGFTDRHSHEHSGGQGADVSVRGPFFLLLFDRAHSLFVPIAVP